MRHNQRSLPSSALVCRPVRFVTEIIRLAQLQSDPALATRVHGGVVSIGNFDGVHRGHADLLRSVRSLADELGGPAIAVVLDPHPSVILRPERAPPRLTWIERRAERMAPLGVDILILCETTPEFLRLTAREFFASLIVEQLQAKALVEGPNFFFGRDRGGDVQVLAQLCKEQQLELRIVEPREADAQMISSTRIRRLLSEGHVTAAGELLGAPYRLRGTVAAGARRGQQIGFPTANLARIDVLVPAPGVYAVRAMIGQQTLAAAVHIGPNPTFDSDTTVKVEVHVLDFDGDLYGQLLLLDFIARVRDIARFDSAAALISQLDRDIAEVRSLLKESPDGR